MAACFEKVFATFGVQPESTRRHFGLSFFFRTNTNVYIKGEKKKKKHNEEERCTKESIANGRLKSALNVFASRVNARAFVWKKKNCITVRLD